MRSGGGKGTDHRQCMLGRLNKINDKLITNMIER